MRWPGIPGARHLSNAYWKLSSVSIQTGERTFCNSTRLFKFLGMSDSASEQIRKIKECFKSTRSWRIKHLIMFESLLFVHGQVPFAEYSAKWNEIACHCPPTDSFQSEHYKKVLGHFRANKLVKLLASIIPAQRKYLLSIYIYIYIYIPLAPNSTPKSKSVRN